MFTETWQHSAQKYILRKHCENSCSPRLTSEIFPADIEFDLFPLVIDNENRRIVQIQRKKTLRTRFSLLGGLFWRSEFNEALKILT